MMALLQGVNVPENAELSDNGATAGVQRTMMGVIPGTHRVDESGGFKVGDDSTLASQDTYLCAYYRIGADGNKRAILERRHHIPTSLCTIGSEPEDVYKRGERYVFDATNGRVNYDKHDKPVKLFMSSNGLGWYQNEPIKDPQVLRALLTGAQVNPTMSVPPVVAVVARAMYCGHASATQALQPQDYSTERRR